MATPTPSIEMTEPQRREALARPSADVQPGAVARFLFAFFDAVYGRELSLLKFRAQELAARTPYQARERIAYAMVTRRYPAAMPEVVEVIDAARVDQDNEQRHLFWLEALCARRGERERWLRDRIVPPLLTTVLGWLARIAHSLHPAWSYHLNAELEQRAERDYLRFVAEHPELEHEASIAPEFETVAEMFRAIALDERAHKEDSLERSGRLRRR